jgi:hypothetical protein
MARSLLKERLLVANPLERMETIRNKVLTGVTGEYYVAAELSRRGYIASITLRNTRGVDILCSNGDASKSVGIQVKTKTGKGRDWILNAKGENYHAPTLFYVFVNITEGGTDYTIVPSKVVAAQITESHSNWLATPSRKGAAHKDSSMRVFRDPKEEYLGRWNLLELD